MSNIRVIITTRYSQVAAKMGADVKAYCVLLGCLLVSVFSESSSDDRQVIRLLALVPFPDPRPSTGWDEGLLVLPAARLAVEHINNRSDILPGYKLELIEASSDACGVKTVSNALVNFVQNTVAAENGTVVGIVGLACSSVASVVSPLAGREEVSLIQLSMGNSPVFQDHAMYPHLWRVLPSTVAFVGTVMSIMKKFNNTKVSVIYDEGVLFSTTAARFIEATRKANMNVTMEATLDSSSDLTRQVNSLLTESNRGDFARIIFASVTRPEAAVLLCRAYHLKLFWPGFLWIFQTRTVDDILSNVNRTSCSEAELRMAMNSTIDVNFQFQPVNHSEQLSSLVTYTQYTKQYAEKLEELLMEDRYAQYNLENYDNNSVWANVMYDEVWAIGSALNKSLPELRQQNLSLEDFHIGNSTITKIIEKQFHVVSFAGAMGQVSFDNVTQEGQTPLKLHIRNCSMDKCDETRIGEFSPRTNTSYLNLTSATVPNDDFGIKHDLLPIWASVLLYGVILAVCLLITYNLLLVFIKWNTHVIKATSPILSLLIFVGCYILTATSLLRLLVISSPHSDMFLSIICSLEVLLFGIGVNLVLGTIVVKLARIFRIFSPFSQMGSGWQSKYLFIAVLVLTFAGTIPAIVWISYDRPEPFSTLTYDYDVNPPIKIRKTICKSEFVFYWLVSIIVIPAIELIFMIFFAYETRKANVKNFKDTKKIISYVFISVSSFGLFIIVFVALFATNTSQDIAYIFLYLTFPVNAQVFLYIPKTVPLMFDNEEHFTLSRTLKTIVSYF